MKFACRERQRILLEAAIWQSLLNESPSEDERSKFAAWLTKSRQHVEIFLYVAVRFPGPTESQPVMPTPAPAGDQASKSYHLLTWVSAISAAAAVAVVAWYARSYSVAPQPNVSVAGTDYQGEGTFMLGPDSTMTLRRGSRVTVFSYTGTKGTRVVVNEGYAEFTGTHEGPNKLSVESNHLVADAVGTTFDVFRKQGSTTLTVTEGGVRVTLHCPSADRSAAAPPRAVLTESQYVDVADDNCFGPLVVKSLESASVQQQAASNTRWLDITQKTVEEAAEQFNHYNAQRERLVVRSAILRNQLIGGRFDLADVDSFIDALKVDYDVKITRHTEQDGSTVIYLDLATGK